MLLGSPTTPPPPLQGGRGGQHRVGGSAYFSLLPEGDLARGRGGEGRGGEGQSSGGEGQWRGSGGAVEGRASGGAVEGQSSGGAVEGRGGQGRGSGGEGSAHTTVHAAVGTHQRCCLIQWKTFHTPPCFLETAPGRYSGLVVAEGRGWAWLQVSSPNQI